MICCSGRNVGLHYGGVASKSLVGWRTISDRIISVRLKSNHGYFTAIPCYSPINGDKEEGNDEFYQTLHGITTSLPKHDVLIVMGDIKAKVGEDNTSMEYLMGRWGKDVRNDNGFLYAR